MAEAISSIMGSYSRLVDDVVEIFVLLHTTFFSVVGCSYLCVRQIARVFVVPTVNICKVIFLTAGLINFPKCAALN